MAQLEEAKHKIEKYTEIMNSKEKYIKNLKGKQKKDLLKINELHQKELVKYKKVIFDLKEAYEYEKKIYGNLQEKNRLQLKNMEKVWNEAEVQTESLSQESECEGENIKIVRNFKFQNFALIFIIFRVIVYLWVKIGMQTIENNKLKQENIEIIKNYASLQEQYSICKEKYNSLKVKFKYAEEVKEKYRNLYKSLNLK